MAQAIIQPAVGGDVHDKDRMLAAFRAHVAAVKAGVPADRFLEFDLRQGWEPLCAFLEVPVPDKPFPHVNSAADTQALLDAVIAAMGTSDGARKAADLVGNLFKPSARS